MTRTSLTSLFALALCAGCQDYSIGGDPVLGGQNEAPDLAPPVGNDVVRLARSGKSDVLWVLDDSGSMSEEQDNLARNLPAFYDRLVEAGVDFHIGVITTDADSTYNAGILRRVAGYNYLSPKIPYADELFEMAVRVGVGGSGDEKGISTTYSALVQPTRQIQEANEGFLREDASLHVIVVSDEDDSSGDLPSTEELATFLTTMKPNPDTQVTFNSIVGPGPSGCSNSDTDAAYGSRYVVTTTRVGGIHRSICEPDWVPLLDELGLQAAGQRKVYYLSRLPLPASIKVRIDDPEGAAHGVKLRQNESPEEACAQASGRCFGFSYDAVQNAVAVVGYDGQDGARVRLTYTLRTGEAVEDVPSGDTDDTDGADTDSP